MHIWRAVAIICLNFRSFSYCNSINSFSVRLDSFSILNCNTSRMRGGTNDCWQVSLVNPLLNLILFNSAFVVKHSPIFQFVFRLYLDLVSLSFTVYSFIGHVFLSRSSRSSKRRGVSEPSAAKAQLTAHGMGLAPISSCSSRTASREADVPVRYIHQRLTWFT